MEVLLDPDGVLELHDGARERLDREHALGWGHGQHLPELSQVGSIFSEHVFGRADGCREFGLVIQDGLRFTHALFAGYRIMALAGGGPQARCACSWNVLIGLGSSQVDRDDGEM